MTQPYQQQHQKLQETKVTLSKFGGNNFNLKFHISKPSTQHEYLKLCIIFYILYKQNKITTELQKKNKTPIGWRILTLLLSSFLRNHQHLYWLELPIPRTAFQMPGQGELLFQRCSSCRDQKNEQVSRKSAAMWQSRGEILWTLQPPQITAQSCPLCLGRAPKSA